jgi:hypothetical protein
MHSYNHLILGQKGLVFDPRTGESYQLNPVAQKMLKYFQTGSTLEEVAHLIATEFGLPAQKALSDVLEFQVQLSVIGLMESA